MAKYLSDEFDSYEDCVHSVMTNRAFTMIYCDNCGERLPDNEYYEINSERLCVHCFRSMYLSREKAIMCDSCESYIEGDAWDINGRILCDDCIKRYLRNYFAYA